MCLCHKYVQKSELRNQIINVTNVILFISIWVFFIPIFFNSLLILQVCHISITYYAMNIICNHWKSFA